VEQQMKKTIMECEERMKEEHWQWVEMEEKHQVMMTQVEAYVAE